MATSTVHKTKNYIRNGNRCNVSTTLASIQAPSTMTCVWSSGQGVIGGNTNEGEIRVFVTTAANVAGTYLFTLSPSTSNGNGTSVGSGSTEGTDLFTSGKSNNSAVITLTAAQIAAISAAITGGAVVFVFDPTPNIDCCIHFKLVSTDV